MVTLMYMRFPALSVVAYATLIICTQSGFTQSLPSAGDRLIWSDQDMSLRFDSIAPDPQTEMVIRPPEQLFPTNLANESQEQSPVCEPGHPALREVPTATYAEADKLGSRRGP